MKTANKISISVKPLDSSRGEKNNPQGFIHEYSNTRVMTNVWFQFHDLNLVISLILWGQDFLYIEFLLATFSLYFSLLDNPLIT